MCSRYEKEELLHPAFRYRLYVYSICSTTCECLEVSSMSDLFKSFRSISVEVSDVLFYCCYSYCCLGVSLCPKH